MVRLCTGEICVCLRESSIDRYIQAAEDIAFAEVLLSSLEPVENTSQGVGKLFASRSGKKTIATFSDTSQPVYDEDAQERLLLAAIQAGATHISIDVHVCREVKKTLLNEAHRHACTVIISYHNTTETPPRKELVAIIEKCFAEGADIAKIACHVHSAKDNARLLGLLDEDRPLVVVGMGPLGRATRYGAHVLGNVLSYVSRGPGSETGPGQLSKDEMQVFDSVCRKFLR